MTSKKYDGITRPSNGYKNVECNFVVIIYRIKTGPNKGKVVVLSIIFVAVIYAIVVLMLVSWNNEHI